MSFEHLGLSPKILQAIEATGYVKPTPIQEQSIPVILKGKDILGGAQTGTGKTAAFALPILELLKNRQAGKKPRALIITPTRELAAQVGASFKTYGEGLRLRSTVIFGGVGINPQIKILKSGVDIVVGTPGRLLDLCNQRQLDLSKIEILVLDEADRMLDMGFIHDIRRIIRLIPVARQTLFFSATYSKEIKSLSDTILKNPVFVEVKEDNIDANNVEQYICHVSQLGKRPLLIHMITAGNWDRVLIFTRTKHRANRLTQQLIKGGIDSVAIHGNKSQNARTKALASFKAGTIKALVATDIAARGLDIDRLPHVVNFDLPHISEDYVHRIGRTGRAGCTGIAFSLVAGEEVKLLRAIESILGRKLPLKEIEGFTNPEPEEDKLPPRRSKKDITNKNRERKPHHGKRKKRRF